MWGLRMCWLFLGLLRLSAGTGEVAGPGACPLYNLSVPLGSWGRLEINVTEESAFLCKMQSTVTAKDPSGCAHLMTLGTTKTLQYYNSTFKDLMALSTQFVTVKKAQKWMAAEYRVITSLRGTCLARINLTVLDPVRELPAAGKEMANVTGEGSSRGTLTNGSATREPRSRYGIVCAAVVVLLLVLLYLLRTRNGGGEGAETQRCCEEEENSDPASVLQPEPNGEAPPMIPLNEVATKPRGWSWLPQSPGHRLRGQ